MLAKAVHANKDPLIGWSIFILTQSSRLAFLLATVLSIIGAYRADGIESAFIMAIPIVGHIWWLVKTGTTTGWVNFYSVTLSVGTAYYILSMALVSYFKKWEEYNVEDI